MGMVWSGIHRKQEVPVAVKVMNAQVARNPASHRAFRAEVRAMARLEHPGIVGLHDYGLVDRMVASRSRGLIPAGCPYLVMELVKPEDLGSVAPVASWVELKQLLLDLLEALAHAHARGMIHRDLKPENVLVVQDEEAGRRRALLTDFGLVHALGSEHRRGLTDSTTAGTPQYMAPEQIMGRFREFGPWTDLYALGCLVYTLCTGKPPFEHSDRGELFRMHALTAPPKLKTPPQTPKGFDAWVARLLEKPPLARFHFAQEAAHALRALDEKVAPPPPSNLRPISARSSRIRLEGTGLGLFGLRPTPLLDREEAWAGLTAALEQVVLEKAPRQVRIDGGPGLGKTRIVNDLIEAAHAHSLAVSIRVNHTPYGDPGASMSRAFAEHMRCLGLTRDELDGFLGTWLQAHSASNPDLQARLAALFAPLTDQPPEQPMARAERNEALLQLLELISRDRPVILMLDNAQWGEDSLELVQLIASEREKRPLPVLIVLATLPSALPVDGPVHDRLEALKPQTPAFELTRLAASDVRTLVGSLLPLERSLVEHVVTRTEGNPLYTVQLVADFVERGALMLGRYGFRLRPGAHVLLPEGIHQAWTRRIQRIAQQISPERPEAATLALELVAVFGGTVVTRELVATCKLQGFNLPEDLAEQLFGEGLASAAEGGWSLRPAALHDTLVRLARESGRWAYHHLTCASALESLYPRRVEVLERIGRHFAEGQAHEKAVRILGEATRARLGDKNLRHAQDNISLMENVLSESSLAPGALPWREVRLLNATRAAVSGEMGWDAWERVVHHTMGRGEDLDVARGLELAAEIAVRVEAPPRKSLIEQAGARWEALGIHERAERVRSL